MPRDGGVSDDYGDGRRFPVVIDAKRGSAIGDRVDCAVLDSDKLPVCRRDPGTCRNVNRYAIGPRRDHEEPLSGLEGCQLYVRRKDLDPRNGPRGGLRQHGGRKGEQKW